LIFSLAGDSLKKPFDSFAQFFTKWHKFFSIILKINSFYLAGFSHWIMFPNISKNQHFLFHLIQSYYILFLLFWG